MFGPGHGYVVCPFPPLTHVLITMGDYWRLLLLPIVGMISAEPVAISYTVTQKCTLTNVFVV